MKTRTIRWTVQRAADEFGVHRATLAKLLKQADTHPGEDGKFSTRQMHAALAGDLEGERVRLTRAQADLAEHRAGEERRELVRASVVRFLFADLITRITQTIRHSSMSRVEKESVAAHIRGFDGDEMASDAVKKANEHETKTDNRTTCNGADGAQGV